MYTELWNLCAGPLVTVPRVGDKVYYFPQGHIEQVSCPIRVSSSGRLFRLYDFASGLPFRAVVSRFRCVWRLRSPARVVFLRAGSAEFRFSWRNSVRESCSRGTVEGFAPFRPLLGPAAVPPVLVGSLACRRIKRGLLSRLRKFRLPRLNLAVLV